MYLFAVAAVLLCVTWIIGSRRISPRSVVWGILLGTCNILANLALLASLDRMPGAVVFPVLQAGIMIVAAGFAAVAWKEQPGRLGIVGIALAAGAVVLINLA